MYVGVDVSVGRCGCTNVHGCVDLWVNACVWVRGVVFEGCKRIEISDAQTTSRQTTSGKFAREKRGQF